MIRTELSYFFNRHILMNMPNIDLNLFTIHNNFMEDRERQTLH
jgi:hypothetical protein